MTKQEDNLSKTVNKLRNKSNLNDYNNLDLSIMLLKYASDKDDENELKNNTRKENIKKTIINIFKNSGKSFYSYEISRKYRNYDSYSNESDVHQAIKSMFLNNILTRFNKRYYLSKDFFNKEHIDVNSDKPSWGQFRSLCTYYIECLRATEGAVAYSKYSDLGTRFISRPLLGIISPTESLSWEHNYFLDNALASLISTKKNDDIVVFGFPVCIVKNININNNEMIALPVFCLRVDIKNTGNQVKLENKNPFIRINPKFLSVLRFLKYSEDKILAFRQACGDTSCNMYLDISELLNIVTSFFPKLCINKKMMPEDSSSYFLENIKNKDTIVNSAVLMLAKRPKYSLRLINELKNIVDQNDNTLQKTALSSFFGPNIHEELDSDNKNNAYVISKKDLSYSQKKATDSILINKLSCITGPPGTGKSQVVSSMAEHCLINNKSMLFSSYNHKALDAVLEKALIPSNDQCSFIRRYNSLHQSNTLELKTILEEVEERNDDFNYDQYNKIKTVVLEVCEENDKLLKDIDDEVKFEKYINQNEKKLKEKLSSIDSDSFEKIVSSLSLKRVLNICDSLINVNITAKIYRFFYYIFRRKLIKLIKKAVLLANKKSNLDTNKYFFKGISELKDCLEIHDKIKKYKLSHKTNYNISKISQKYNENNKKLSNLIDKLIDLRIKEPVSDAKLNHIGSIKSLMKNWKRNIKNGIYLVDWSEQDTTYLKELLQHISCFSVTNLSIGRFIPLLPSLFDYSIIDEAAASDFPSSIPILFRSNQVAIVGDPHQLSPVNKLRDDLDEKLRIENNLKEKWVDHYSFKYRSLFEVGEIPKNSEKVFLSDNFRSDSSIVNYSNIIEYNNKIQSRAFTENLLFPKNYTRGIHWIDIKTDISERDHNISFPEIEKVISTLKKIIDENGANFEGSVAITTPFINQANRIEDRIEKEFSVEKREKHKLISRTVHSFQGGERDCMILSLCAGNFLKEGACDFLERNSKLFNVAVSRARSTLIIVGDLEWAKQSKAHHIRTLTQTNNNRKFAYNNSQWFPYESPWEKRLAEKLIDLGFNPIPQYPVGNRRLDLALIDEKRNVFIDVEVDGCAFHRRSDGTRRVEDLWRNYQLSSVGWKIMRFWVYELRENIEQCALEVQKAFKKGGANEF